MKHFLKCLRKFHKDNRGGALIVVIVCVLFLSVLATTILYTSGSNIQMKRTDYETKKNFYEAERVLELMQVALTEDVSLAAANAYTRVLQKFMTDDNPDTRKGQYEAYFKEEFEKLFNKKGTTPDKKLEMYLLEKVTYSTGIFSVPGLDLSGEGLNDTFYVDTATYPASFQLEWDDSQKKNKAGDITLDRHYLLKDICIVYTSSTGYTSRVKTSFVIVPPALNWSPSSSFSVGSLTYVDCMDCVRYQDWVKE